MNLSAGASSRDEPLASNTGCVSKNDKSDRKAMDLLISNLTKQKEEHTKSLSKEVVTTTKKDWRKRKPPAPTTRVQKPQKTRKMKGTKRAGITDENKRTSRSPKLTEEQSEMFKRYGIIIPTCDEILKSAENLTVIKEMLDQCNTMDEYVPKKLKEVRHTEKPLKKLDCGHLSPDDLTAGFKRHQRYIKGVFRGDVYSKRHSAFRESNGNAFQLTCCASTYVFAYKQKKHLIRLLQESLGGDYNDQYAFKVLLPELCLKIFMDAHSMSHEEAVDYLDNMPMDA